MSEIDTSNTQMAAMQSDQVIVMFPRQTMTPSEARLHAAWLVCIADIIDPDPEVGFPAILEAINNT